MKRLNTSTQMMDSANVGTLALLGSLVVAILWAMLSTLTSPPTDSDALSTLVFSLCVTGATTFLLYKTHVPQQQCVHTRARTRARTVFCAVVTMLSWWLVAGTLRRGPR